MAVGQAVALGLRAHRAKVLVLLLLNCYQLLWSVKLCLPPALPL